MEKILLVNESDKGVRIAVVENGRPVEYYFDSKDEIPEDSIILGRVMEHATALDAYFIDVGNEKKAYLPEKNKYGMNIKQNAIMPFQVLHGERGSKGMYLSCKLLVYGKYCICGNISKDLRVSAKITDENERKRLGHLIDSLSGNNREIIIRTVAQYAGSEDIQSDIQDCLERLDDIESATGNPGDILCNPDDLIDIIMKRYDPETD
ncbi:MAG: ribonuclease E/G, partial [Clostridia bacterium]|nr:ribonuclease E/G [Clostridia bacterium]